MVHQRELLINFTYANEGQGGISRKRVLKEGRKRVFLRGKKLQSICWYVRSLQSDVVDWCRNAKVYSKRKCLIVEFRFSRKFAFAGWYIITDTKWHLSNLTYFCVDKILRRNRMFLFPVFEEFSLREREFAKLCLSLVRKELENMTSDKMCQKS
jgi:hypothetical protein